MRFNPLCRESFVLQAQFNSIIWDCSWWQFSLFCSAATVFQWPSCSEQRTEQGLKLPADVQVGGHGVHLWHEAQCRRGIEMSSNNTIQYLLGGTVHISFEDCCLLSNIIVVLGLWYTIMTWKFERYLVFAFSPLSVVVFCFACFSCAVPFNFPTSHTFYQSVGIMVLTVDRKTCVGFTS